MSSRVPLFLLLSLAPAFATAQDFTALRYNQLGYYPGDSARVVVPFTGDLAFPGLVYRADGSEVEVPYRTKVWQEAAAQNAHVRTLPPQPAGTCLKVGGPKGYDGVAVCWKDDPYARVLPAALKSYTYQRAGVPVDASWGGKWARPAGHPDTAVRFHRTAGRDTAVTYASPGGWYDAGDYGKYVVNAGFSVGLLLQLAEQYPGVLADGTVGFSESESSNNRSDLLDELKYELDWMLTMQDPADGGVHHKLTTLDFQGMDMPHEMTAQRYIMAKSTTATLDFAAGLAHASRVFAKAGEEAYARTLLEAAERAYDWAQKHPDTAFENPADVRTGEYGDDSATEEWLWARTELFLTTGSREYEPDGAPGSTSSVSVTVKRQTSASTSRATSTSRTSPR